MNKLNTPFFRIKRVKVEMMRDFSFSFPFNDNFKQIDVNSVDLLLKNLHNNCAECRFIAQSYGNNPSLNNRSDSQVEISFPMSCFIVPQCSFYS